MLEIDRKPIDPPPIIQLKIKDPHDPAQYVSCEVETGMLLSLAEIIFKVHITLWPRISGMQRTTIQSSARTALVLSQELLSRHYIGSKILITPVNMLQSFELPHRILIVFILRWRLFCVRRRVSQTRGRISAPIHTI